MIQHDDKVNMVMAIIAINPDAQVDISGDILTTDNYDLINWNEGTPVIPKADLDAKIIELEAEWVAQEYARNRQPEYPSTGDQLDMMYKDNKNSTTTHADTVEAIKNKWPKDNTGPV
ncbi:MAG: hypothetical protein VX237_03915 [Chloroflexota bacterium]|nr:hypothetical protein [Chloroflexota bacterium]